MLNLNAKTRSQLVLAVTLVAPVLTVQAARLLVMPGASLGAAAAATVGSRSGLPPIAGQPTKPLTAEQLRATTWLMSRTRPLRVRSPMDRPDPKPVDPAPQAEVPAPPPTIQAHETAAPSNLLLTGLIAGGARNDALASINHKVYRVGDSVATNWALTEIDARNRLVIITGPDGRQIRLTPTTSSPAR